MFLVGMAARFTKATGRPMAPDLDDRQIATIKFRGAASQVATNRICARFWFEGNKVLSLGVLVAAGTMGDIRTGRVK